MIRNRTLTGYWLDEVDSSAARRLRELPVDPSCMYRSGIRIIAHWFYVVEWNYSTRIRRGLLDQTASTRLSSVRLGDYSLSLVTQPNMTYYDEDLCYQRHRNYTTTKTSPHAFLSQITGPWGPKSFESRAMIYDRISYLHRQGRTLLHLYRPTERPNFIMDNA